MDVATNSSLNAIKKVSISRTKFYELQELIFGILVMNISLTRKEERCYGKLLPKTTAPKIHSRKYSDLLFMCIAAYYDEQMEKEGMNVNDIMLMMRHKTVVFLNGREDVSHISEPTITKALKLYSKHWKKQDKKDNYIFRLKPYQMVKLGRVQLDVKYLTPRFTGLKRTLY
ncbi:hypothetical protein Barb6_03764 [Bacteroidales bacterium Barb6]|nr:hypothetical protein Barb6_03764 [Bacteroidales bacterium Barb6]